MQDHDTTQKRCTGVCGRALPREAFGRHKDAPDGLQWWCRACMRSYHQEHQDEHNARSRERGHAQTARRRAERAANPPPPRTRKRCCLCREVLPLEVFHRNRRTKDGYGTICKSCRKTYDRAHREGKAIYDHAYNAANQEKIAARAAAYRAANRERLRQAKQDYHRANAAAIVAKVIAWQQANPERRKVILARSRSRHPEYSKVSLANRRTRLRLAGGHIGARDVRAMHVAQRGGCAYCGDTLGPRYHLDHMMPVSKGGCNDPANGCLTCQKCNLRKATRSAGEFLALLIKEGRRSRD